MVHKAPAAPILVQYSIDISVVVHNLPASYFRVLYRSGTCTIIVYDRIRHAFVQRLLPGTHSIRGRPALTSGRCFAKFVGCLLQPRPWPVLRSNKRPICPLTFCLAGGLTRPTHCSQHPPHHRFRSNSRSFCKLPRRTREPILASLRGGPNHIAPAARKRRYPRRRKAGTWWTTSVAVVFHSMSSTINIVPVQACSNRGGLGACPHDMK